MTKAVYHDVFIGYLGISRVLPGGIGELDDGIPDGVQGVFIGAHVVRALVYPNNTDQRS